MANSEAVELDHATFFRVFLSPPHTNFRTKRASPEPFAVLKSANKLSEDDISQRFITAVRTHHLTPGSTLTTVPVDSEAADSERKALAAIYRSMDVPKRRGGHPHWADQKVSFQFSRYAGGGLDPFAPRRLVWGMNYTETEEELECKALRKRIYDTAELLFAAQHRVFLFMVLVIGRQFRILRWDRAGVIVTPSVDYVESSALLCDCLRRLSLLDDISLGFDPTATRLRPCDPDFLRMDAAALEDPRDVDHAERPVEAGGIGDASVFRYVRSTFRGWLSTDWPRYRLRIQDRDGHARDYLVGKPVCTPDEIVGRGTRGYVALDCETERFVWLKDVWRACDLAEEREGDLLRKLNLAGVVNVPTLVCHGDVQDQATVTRQWWDITHGVTPGSSSGSQENGPSRAARQTLLATGREDYPLRHTHYRIVFKEVAMSLSQIRCGKQLASVVLDCLHAHHQASTNPNVRLLHGDISVGNLLIYPRVRPDEDGKGLRLVWTGMLTDWELAKHIDTERSLQEKHVGTHLFMSANLVCNPFQAAEIPDELESFFHLLVYCSVRFLRSNCPHRDAWINTYFKPGLGLSSYFWGMKVVAIKQDGQLSTIYPPGPLLFDSPMDRLLGELIKSFTAHYKVRLHEIRQAQTPLFSPSPTKSSSAADKSDSQRATTKRGKYLVPTPRYSDDSNYSDADVAEWKPYKPPDTTPTLAERDLARRVEDHDFTLDFIAELLRNTEWPEDDLLANPPVPAPKPQLEPGPKRAQVDTDTAEAPAPKRRRKAAPKEQVAGPSVQTAHRSARARQTRSKTRGVSSKTRSRRRS